MNKISLTVQPLSKIQFRLPEKWKGGRIERYVHYWKGVYHDYKQVAVEVYADCKDRPANAIFIASGISAFVYAMKTNPDEQSFRDRVILSSNRLMLTSSSTRNPSSVEHLKYLTRCYNQGLFRRFSFGVVSIIWVENYDKACDLYEAHCRYLKPQYTKFYERIVDVGFLGKWYFLANKMVDYDVNPLEWQNEKQNEGWSILETCSNYFLITKQLINTAINNWTT